MLAKRSKCNQSYMVETIQRKADWKYRKRILAPDQSDKQNEVICPCCSINLNKFHVWEVILDSEPYFTYKNSDKNVDTGFYTADFKATPETVKQKTKKKLEKLMILLAMSSYGFSHPYIPSSMSINQVVYRDECFKKRLILFIQDHHADGNDMFWLDLPSLHYVKSMVSCLWEQNIILLRKIIIFPPSLSCNQSKTFNRPWKLLCTTITGSR